MSKSVYIKILLLLLLAVTMGCKKEVDTPSPAPEVQTVHYKAAVHTGADTRATVGDGLKYEFEEGDKVYLSSEDGNLYGFLSLSVDGGIGKDKALFEGELTYLGNTALGNPAVNLVLVSKEDDLHTIADGRVADVTAESYLQNKWAPSLEEAVSRLSHFTGSGHLNDFSFTLHQQSSFLKCYVRLKSEQAPVDQIVKAKLLNNNSVVLREASIKVCEAGSVPFVFAFLGGEALENAKLEVEWEESVGTSFDLSSKTLAANNYYTVSRSTLSFDGFRIRAISNNTTITFNYNYANDGIEYSLDFGESWTHYTEPFSLNADDVACIKGNRVDYKNGGADQYDGPKDKPIFRASLKCYISGNIMSLVGDAPELSESAFQGAFSRGGSTANANIDIDPDSPLILPATTLATKCYMNMFRNCTSLTRAPQFRVEVTASNCCYNMFRQCSNLVDVSGIELPAQTLSEDCYRELFRQCTKLTTAPVLPARTLVKSCYRQMFSACSALTSVTCLATDISAEDCTNNWMGDVPNNQTVPRTFYVASEEMKSIWSRSISGILSNWKVEVYSE